MFIEDATATMELAIPKYPYDERISGRFSFRSADDLYNLRSIPLSTNLDTGVFHLILL